MAVEENGGGLVVLLPLSSSSQRQRFYVELIPGETTIVSWKKLIRKAREKDQSHPVAATVMGSLSGAHSSSSAHETPKRVLGNRVRLCTSDPTPYLALVGASPLEALV